MPTLCAISPTQQWNYIEQNMPTLCAKHGVLMNMNGGVCEHYGLFMHIMHAPCLIGAVLDILAKRRALAAAAASDGLPTFSPRALLQALTAYHVFFQSWYVRGLQGIAKASPLPPSHTRSRAHAPHDEHHTCINTAI